MSSTITPVLGEATMQELRESLQGDVALPNEDAYAEQHRYGTEHTTADGRH